MLAGVLLHLIEPPVPVDAAGHGWAGHSGSGQSIHRMPEDARLLVDVQHPQHRAVRSGSECPGRRADRRPPVEHRAVQRDAPAAGLFVRLCGKDDALHPVRKASCSKYFSVRCIARVPPVDRTIENAPRLRSGHIQRKIIFIRVCRALRSAPNAVFTERGVTPNCICSAAFYESAALRASACSPSGELSRSD